MSKWSKRSKTPPPETRKRRRFRFDSPPKADSSSHNQTQSVGSSRFTVNKGPESPQKTNLSETAVSKYSATEEELQRCREVYVGNVPPSVTKGQLAEFMNAALQALNANIFPGPPILKSMATKDRQFVFFEFRCIEEANNCVALDGISCINSPLRIGRPKSYPTRLLEFMTLQAPTIKPPSLTNISLSSVMKNQANSANAGGGSAPNSFGGFSGVSTINTVSQAMNPLTGQSVTNCPEALFIRGLPSKEILSKYEVQTLLETFGAVQQLLHIPIDRNSVGRTDNPKMSDMSMTQVTVDSTATEKVEDQEESVAIATYVNPADSATCRDYLSGWSWGTLPKGTRLQVLNSRDIWDRIANVPALFANLEKMHRYRNIATHDTLNDIPSRCIWIPGVLTFEECLTDDRYFELMEDIEDEIKLFADVWDVKIPRPTSKLLYTEFGLRNPRLCNPIHNNTDEFGLPRERMPFEWTDSGTGDVFIELANVQEAAKLMNLFHNRVYNKRPVYMHYFNEGLMLEGFFTNPGPLYCKSGSSLYNPKLAELQKMRFQEFQENLELEREEEEEARRERAEFIVKEEDRRKQLEAEAELMAAEEVAKKREIMQNALLEIGSIAPNVNAASAQERDGEFVKEEESSMNMSDEG